MGRPRAEQAAVLPGPQRGEDDMHPESREGPPTVLDGRRLGHLGGRGRRLPSPDVVAPGRDVASEPGARGPSDAVPRDGALPAGGCGLALTRPPVVTPAATPPLSPPL